MSNRRRQLLSLLAAALVLGGGGACSSGAGDIAMLAAAEKPANAVPPAPAGWTTVFSDAFSGKAGQAPSEANLFYTVGTGYDPGAVDQVVDSPKNAYVGNGHLILKAFRTTTGAWRSARIQSTRDDFRAPAGGELT